jgi:SAM-dependent methyltransferase
MSTMWDSTAPGWRANAEFVDEQLAEATQSMLDAAAVGDGANVLDLGTGPGGAGLAAARRVGSDGTVLLSDVSSEMIEVAADRARADSRVRTAVFDQSLIALDDATCDVVLCRHGLMFADDPVAAVAEVVRVLRPGGRYATMTWGRRENNPWLGLVLDAVSDQFGVPFPPPGVRGPFSLDTPEELAQVLKDGGLHDVAVQTVATPMPAASLEEWWQRVPSLAGPLAVALAGMEPAVRDAIAQRALGFGARAAEAEAEGISFPGTSLIGSGSKPSSPTI